MLNNSKPLKMTDSEENKIRMNLEHLKGIFRNRFYPERQNGVKAYNMDSTDRRMEDPGCAQVKSDYYMPFTRRQVDNVFNKLYDTQNQYEVHEKGWEPYTCEDHDGEGERNINPSEKLSDIVEDSFQTPDNRRDFFTGVKSTLIVWNGFIESRVKDVRWCPETMIRDVWSFSLYFFTNQDFYESGLPVNRRQIATFSNIIQVLDWYGIDIETFKKEYNKGLNLDKKNRIKEDNERKAVKAQGQKYDESKSVMRAKDKRDDEKIWEARFHGDFLISQCAKPKAKCNKCKKDECTCVKLPGDNKLVWKAHPLDSVFSYDDNDAMHEFNLYWTREFLFVIVDDIVFLKYNNPISNPCGEMTDEEKRELEKMEKKIKDVKVGKNKKEKADNKKKKQKYTREKEIYEGMFQVDYFGPYHPYAKLDIDPNSKSQIQMWLWPNGYREQLLYNSVFNNWIDKYRTVADLTGMFTMGEDQEIMLPNWVELKNGQMPMMKWLVVKIKGEGPGLRTLWENLTMWPNDLNILNYLDATSDRTAGLTSVTWGAEKGIQRVPGAVQALTQVTAQNLQPLVESMSHAMSKVVLVRQRLLLNWMDKNLVDEVKIRKRRWGSVMLTRDDLKRDFHIVVNNKSLTTLQNFNTTIQKINALGQIQPLLINPITWDPYLDYKPIVKSLLWDLDIDCDVELTNKEIFDMKKQGIKENTKLTQLQTKDQRKVEYTEITSQEKLQQRLLKRAEKLLEREAEEAWAFVQNPGATPTDPQALQQSQVVPVLWNLLPPEQLQQLAQTVWVPLEQLAQYTEQDFANLEQQILNQEAPLIESVESDAWDLGFF